MALALSTSSARASSSRGYRPPPWVLVHRAPQAADLLTSSEADVVLGLVPPPGVTTAFVDTALLPAPAAAAADDDDDAAAAAARLRIHGADASGRLLFGFPTPRAAGDSHLVVCRLVPGTSGETATGKAAAIPAFPEAPGHALSVVAPTGILFDPEAKTGDGYFVTQLKSAPGVASVLIFSSDTGGWSVAEVPAVGRWNGFSASSVISHDRGDSGGFVFVDLRLRALLLLHPRSLAAGRFIGLPVLQGEGGGGEIDATVGSSDGRLVYALFEELQEGMRIRFWFLSEDEQRWCSYSRLSTEEVFGRDAHVWPLRGAPMLGPIDPTMSNRIVFGDRDATVAFFVGVTPDELAFLRVCPRALDSLVCLLPPPPKASWSEAFNTAIEGGKHVGMVMVDAVQKARPYADSLPVVVEMVGTTLGLPYTAVALVAAKAVQRVNNYITFTETASRWCWEHRPGADARLHCVVESFEEADQALDQWDSLGRPTNMLVESAPGMPQPVWDRIRLHFKDYRACSLLRHPDDWYMVDQAPN